WSWHVGSPSRRVDLSLYAFLSAESNTRSGRPGEECQGLRERRNALHVRNGSPRGGQLVGRDDEQTRPLAPRSEPLQVHAADIADGPRQVDRARGGDDPGAAGTGRREGIGDGEGI